MRKSNLIKKVDNQIYFRLFVTLLWSREILLDYIRSFLSKLPVLSFASDYIIPAVLFLAFLLAYKTIAERLRGPDFVFVMICILAYVGEFFFFKRNRDYFRMEWVQFIIGCLPLYFVGIALKSDDESKLLPWLYGVSVISTIAFAIYIMFINEMEGLTLRAGDMNSAYDMLPHACLTFYFMIKNFKWRRLFIFLIAGISILMMGTRGAVICLLAFMVLATIVTIRFRRPIILLCMVMTCLLFIIFKEMTDFLIESAYSIGETFGLSTRIFDKLLSGDFAVSTARVYLKERVRHYLYAYPLVGLGIYGDRVATGGQYVHNFFLEIYSHFGIPIGTLMAIALTALAYRGIRFVFKSGDKNAQLVIMLLLSYCFKLLVSSSYLREPFFWLLIGYLAGIVRESRVTAETGRALLKKSKLIK